VRFDDSKTNLFPLSETCFKAIILPTKHTEYEMFKINVDIALKLGATGFVFN
jgi:hypothetical protein